jgi:hypothetical protein
MHCRVHGGCTKLASCLACLLSEDWWCIHPTMTTTGNDTEGQQAAAGSYSRAGTRAGAAAQ